MSNYVNVLEGTAKQVFSRVNEMVEVLLSAIKVMGTGDDDIVSTMLTMGVCGEEEAEKFAELPVGKKIRELNALIRYLEDVVDDFGYWEQQDCYLALQVDVDAKSILPRYRVRGLKPAKVEYLAPAGFKSWKDAAAAAQDASKIVLWNERDAMMARHRMLTKEGEQFAIMSLNENAEGTFSPMAVKLPVNLETSPLESTVHADNVHINSAWFDKQERFSRAVLNLSVENPKLLDLFLRQRLYVVVKRGANGYAVSEDFFVDSVNPGQAYNLVTGEEEDALFLSNKADDVQVFTYMMDASISSPGQEKQREITLYCADLEGFDAWGHVNDMTHGAFGLLVKYYRDNKLDSMKAAAQAATRCSQFKAGMRKLRPISGIAISMTKFKDDLGNEWADGLEVFTAEGAARALEDDDFFCMPDSMDGNGAQARPLIVDKGLGWVTPWASMKERLDTINSKLVFRFQDDLGDTQEEYNQAVLDHCGPLYDLTDEDKAKGYTCVTLVVLPSRKRMDGTLMETEEELLQQVEVWVDLNVHKTVCDLSREFTGLNFMDISHGKEALDNEANSSNQLLATAAHADPFGTLRYMKSHASGEALDLIANALSKEGKVLRAADLDGDLSMAAQTVHPEFARENWAPYFQDNLNKVLEGWSHRLEKLSVATHGIYLKIMPDISHFYAINLLKYDTLTGECEIFAPMLEKTGVRRAIGIKYPKMCFDEFGKFRAVYSEELIERARKFYHEGKITHRQFVLLKHEIRHFHSGNVMVPAIEGLKNMLAGMDFDGDALVLYTDVELVDMIWTLRPVATTIMEDSEFNDLAKKIRAQKETEAVTAAAAQE